MNIREAIQAIKDGTYKVGTYVHVEGEAIPAEPLDAPKTRCVKCQRIAKIDEEGRCYPCVPKEPLEEEDRADETPLPEVRVCSWRERLRGALR